MNKNKDLDKIKRLCYKHMKTILTATNYKHLKSNLVIKINNFNKKGVYADCLTVKDKVSITISKNTLKKDDNFIEFVMLHELFHVLTQKYVFSEIEDINEFTTHYLCLIHCNENNGFNIVTFQAFGRHRL